MKNEEKEKKEDEGEKVRKRIAVRLIYDMAADELDCSTAICALIEALKDEDEVVRQRVVSALGEIGDVRAVPGLIEALKDKNKDVRWRAAVALGKIAKKGGDCSAAVPGLIEALKDREEDVRREVITALGEIGDERAILDILKFLEDEEWNMRARAENAVERIIEKRGIAVLPYLVKALKDE